MSRPLPPLKTSGTVEEHQLYIERPEDDQVYSLLREGSYCNILTSRQMGKSSLVVRLRKRLNKDGIRVLSVSLEGVGGNQLKSARAWYKSVLGALAVKLGRLDAFEIWWAALDTDAPMAAAVRGFAGQFLLADERPVVVVLDEVDVTRALPFADDLFLALRAMHNERAEQPALARLTFCLLGVLSTADLIKEDTATPYNIGSTVRLSDFSRQTCDLEPLDEHLAARGLGGKERVDEVLQWTGGQPFLTISLCDKLVRHDSTSLTALVREEVGNPTSFAVHFGRIEQIVRERITVDSKVRGQYLRMLRGAHVRGVAEKDEESLLLAGLARRDADGMLTLRNRIYGRRFNARWVRRVMPAPPVPRWLLALVAALVVAVVYGLWRWQRDQQIAAARDRIETALTEGVVKLSEAQDDASARAAWEALRVTGVNLDDKRVQEAASSYWRRADQRLIELAEKFEAAKCAEEAALVRTYAAARGGGAADGAMVDLRLAHTHALAWLPQGPLVGTEVERCEARRLGSCDRLTFDGDKIVASCSGKLLTFAVGTRPVVMPGDRGQRAVLLPGTSGSSVGHIGAELMFVHNGTSTRLQVCQKADVTDLKVTRYQQRLGLAFVCGDGSYGWRFIDDLDAWLLASEKGQTGWTKGYNVIAVAWLNGVLVQGRPGKAGKLHTLGASSAGLPYVTTLASAAGDAGRGAFATEDPVAIGVFAIDRQGLFLRRRQQLLGSQDMTLSTACESAQCLLVAVAAGPAGAEMAGLLAEYVRDDASADGFRQLREVRLVYADGAGLRQLALGSTLPSPQTLAIGSWQRESVMAVAEAGRIRLLTRDASNPGSFDEMQRRLGLTVKVSAGGAVTVESLDEVPAQAVPRRESVFRP